ncbi:MAG: long-chain fatty acid--CoA ligase [Spirochaetaceae bacterium]|nr:MAG: long-chain fatty acid--CoA ligase [Spirochaetaceae bacterium]
MTVTTLRELLENSVAAFPERPALGLVGDGGCTYRELGEQVKALQKALASRGVQAGDHVALLSENRPNWGVVYLAVTGMGAVIVPILPDFSPAEIAQILDHAGVSVLCASRGLYPKVAEYTDARLLLVDDLQFIKPGTPAEGLPPHGPPSGVATGLLGRKTSSATAEAVPAENDLAAILYTSGTTGEPKGVMLTHRNLVQNALAARVLAGLGPEDRLVSILPLAHAYECTIGFLIPVSTGSSVLYLGKPPTLSVLLPALEEVKPTVMLSVPLIMEKIYQSRVAPVFNGNVVTRAVGRIGPLRRIVHRAAGKKVYQTFGGKLRFFGIGGAPLSPQAERFLREARFPYAIGYGLTETSPLVAGTGAADTRSRSTGPPIAGVEVRIDHESGDGVNGEIQVRGANVMQGYYRNEEATRQVFTDDGWFKTGDLGAFDKDGYLYIRGRLKNMILGPSGENIYPEDIESAINQNELVVESLVFQWKGQLVARVHVNIDRLREHSGIGEENVAAIQKRADEILDGLRSQVNARLGRFARLSRMILEWEPFEKTPTQKIKRFLYTHLGQQKNKRT